MFHDLTSERIIFVKHAQEAQHHQQHHHQHMQQGVEQQASEHMQQHQMPPHLQQEPQVRNTFWQWVISGSSVS